MKGSILFVHGAGHAAWCWRDNFTGWFEAMGYLVTAPDLPGHGDEDRAGIKKIPLSTYVSAVALAAELLPRPLTLVGHSMGGFIIQKYLETAEADLAILLASTPPSGAFGMVKRMATRRPRALVHTMISSEGSDSLQTTRDYFFSPDTSDDVVRSAHRRLQPESTRALKEMMGRLHSERVKTSVVVMGARNDWLVAPPDELFATAKAFNTAPVVMSGGHDMMLDFAWEQVAAEIDRSIIQRVGAQPTSLIS